MISSLFEKYVSTHTEADRKEVAFATGRSPRPYSRSYYMYNKPNRENNILREIPSVQPKQERPVQQPKQKVEKQTMSMAEYSSKLDEAVAMCKRRK